MKSVAQTTRCRIEVSSTSFHANALEAAWLLSANVATIRVVSGDPSADSRSNLSHNALQSQARSTEKRRSSRSLFGNIPRDLLSALTL